MVVPADGREGGHSHRPFRKWCCSGEYNVAASRRHGCSCATSGRPDQQGLWSTRARTSTRRSGHLHSFCRTHTSHWPYSCRVQSTRRSGPCTALQAPRRRRHRRGGRRCRAWSTAGLLVPPRWRAMRARKALRY